MTQSETYSFQALTRQLTLAALAGDDGGDAFVLQPLEQAAQLRAQDRLIAEAAEQRLDRVEHDALGADRIDGVTQADEQAFEVVLARLLDLAAFDVDVVHFELAVVDEVTEVVAERGDVLD